MDWARSDGVRRKLTIAMAVVFVLSLAGVVYFAMTPQATTDPYTELYVLGPDGNASGYPTNLSVGESGTIIVGVVNQEHVSVTYTVRIDLHNETIDERQLRIENGERWEERFSISPHSVGRHRLWIRLYRGETVDSGSDPYRELWLWMEVSP